MTGQTPKKIEVTRQVAMFLMHQARKGLRCKWVRFWLEPLLGVLILLAATLRFIWKHPAISVVGLMAAGWAIKANALPWF